VFTRCPACHTVHPINAELLARGGGKFRCGKCRKVSNALEALFDQWPDASQQGPQAGELPELGMSLSLHSAGGNSGHPDDTVTVDDTAGGPSGKKPPGGAWLRVLWITAALVLTLVVGFSLATFYRLPVLQHPLLQPLLVTLGLEEGAEVSAVPGPGKVELLARTMKPHPSRTGVLLLTASIVSRSADVQAYPDVDVTLMDIRGRHLSRKLFKPADYLTSTAQLRSGMAPGGHLTFTLEIEDPGNAATGFELQFQ
jgi:predicted Zn finger-like uncharacterized protein